MTPYRLLFELIAFDLTTPSWRQTLSATSEREFTVDEFIECLWILNCFIVKLDIKKWFRSGF